LPVSTAGGSTVLLTESIRVSVPASSLLTQMVVPATAIPLGPSPTAIVTGPLLEVGSTRVTVPSRLFATQIASGPTATPPAPLPVVTDCSIFPLASILVTVPLTSLVTQADPSSSAIPSALWPTLIGARGLSVRSLIRVTVPSLEFATQT
jgi:hypothetical protein